MFSLIFEQDTADLSAQPVGAVARGEAKLSSSQIDMKAWSTHGGSIKEKEGKREKFLELTSKDDGELKRRRMHGAILT